MCFRFGRKRGGRGDSPSVYMLVILLSNASLCVLGLGANAVAGALTDADRAALPPLLSEPNMLKMAQVIVS